MQSIRSNVTVFTFPSVTYSYMLIQSAYNHGTGVKIILNFKVHTKLYVHVRYIYFLNVQIQLGASTLHKNTQYDSYSYSDMSRILNAHKR